MELTLDQALQKGIEAHKAGKVQEADAYYTSILKANPKHPDANHNMGVLAVGVGKVEEALSFLKTALEVNPNITQFWLSYIDALIKLDQIDQAKAALEKARQAGAKGENLDQIEQRIGSPSSRNSDEQDLSQNQIQHLINLYNQGQLREIIKQASQMLLEFPNSSTLFNVIGVANKGLGKFEKAIEAYKKAISIKPDYAEAHNNIGNALQDQGKLDEAIEAYKNTLTIKPDYADAYYNLGNALQAYEKFEEAAEAYKKAISIKPDYTDAYNNLGITLKEQGKLDEAIEAYNKALTIKPDYSKTHNNIGNALKDQRKLDEAIEAFNKALAIKPDYAEAYNNLGITLKEKGKFNEAIEAYNKALSIKPDYAEVCNNLGNVLQDQGKLDEAIEAYNKALSIKPDYAEVYTNVGNVLQEQGKLDEAIEAYNKALSIKPDYAEAYNGIGNALKDHNKLEEAKAAFNKALSIKSDLAEAHRNLSSINKYTADNAHFITVRNLANNKDLDDSSRCNLNFALSKMYDDIGDYKEAFKHLSNGNALRKELYKYSIEQDKNLFKKIKMVQPDLYENSLKFKKGSTSVSPIFILGMLRSGTTLVEQIISSHSKVTGAGELNYVAHYGAALATGTLDIDHTAITNFRKQYLLQLAQLSNGNSIVTDKMPQNFYFIPLICAAFPEAKIIHVQRNAAATCWSNYKHYFKSKGHGYCYNLTDVVTYYNLYFDMMERWQTSYHNRIYNVNYETLTNDQEKETKQLIKHLGLTWEEACLAPQNNKRSVRTASQQQVRQKIYKGSSDVWKRYEPYLNGVFDDLPGP